MDRRTHSVFVGLLVAVVAQALLASPPSILVSPPRDLDTLPGQAPISPTAVYDLNSPSSGFNAISMTDRVVDETMTFVSSPAVPQSLATTLMLSPTGVPDIYFYVREDGFWRFSRRATVQLGPADGFSGLTFFGHKAAFPGSLCGATPLSSYFYVLQFGGDPAGFDVPPVMDSSFGTRPQIYSVSYDETTAQLLVVSASFQAPDERARISIHWVYRNDTPGSIVQGHVRLHTAPFDPPWGARMPFFATWRYEKDQDGKWVRGILMPYGTEYHEGLVWAPLPMGRASPPADGWRAARFVDVPDRTLRAGVVWGDSLYAVGGQSSRLYEFPLPLPPVVPSVKGLNMSSLGGDAGVHFLSWDADGIAECTVSAYAERSSLVRDGRVLADRTLEVRGYLPGTPVSVVTERAIEGGSRQVSAFSQRVLVPSEESWSTIRLDMGAGSDVSALAFDPTTRLLFVGRSDGGVASIEFESVKSLLDEVRGSQVPGVLAPRPASPDMFSPEGGPASVTALGFGPGGDMLLADGWAESLRFQGQTILVGPLTGNERTFVTGAAFLGPGGGAGATGISGLVLADAAGNRFLRVDLLSHDVTPLAGILPVERVEPADGVGLSGSGPFGVSAAGRELFFLWRRPGSGDLVLCSSGGGSQGLARGRPREVVPVSTEFVPTSLAVVPLADSEALAIVGGNGAGEPMLLVKRVTLGVNELLAEIDGALSAGQSIDAGVLTCPALLGRDYTIVVSRRDSAADQAPVSVKVSAEGTGAFSFTREAEGLRFGDSIACVLSGVGQRLSLSVESVGAGDETSLFRVSVLASGRGRGCFEGELAFLRGDTNLSSHVDVADAITLLGYLFAGKPATFCMDAGDINDDGAMSIADPISLLSAVFTRGGPVPQPFPACGVDPTPDALPPCTIPSPCSLGL